MANQFYRTRDTFKTLVDYSEPLSYDEWVALDDRFKVAVLYLQFFDQITLAWYKVSSGYATDDDGVETVIQYLSKNVDRIKENPRRFTPRYIYRVAYNCLYCISFDRKCDKWESENVIPAVTYTSSGDEFNLFDIISDPSVDAPFAEAVRNRFWKEVENMGEDTTTFIANVLDGVRLPAGFGGKKKKAEIASKLEKVLSKYKTSYYN